MNSKLIDVEFEMRMEKLIMLLNLSTPKGEHPLFTLYKEQQHINLIQTRNGCETNPLPIIE